VKAGTPALPTVVSVAACSWTVFITHRLPLSLRPPILIRSRLLCNHLRRKRHRSVYLTVSVAWVLPLAMTVAFLIDMKRGCCYLSLV